MAPVRMSVMVIIAWKYLRANGGGDGLDEWLGILFLTEYTNMALIAANIMKKMTKIEEFTWTGSSVPLYEENFTIVESKTTIPVKIKMKRSEFFLVRFKVA